MLYLESDITRKRRVYKMLDIKPIFNIRNNKKYKVKAICNSKVYAKKDIR